MPLEKLSEHLAVHLGPVNVGVVLDGDRALLIDCGEGSVVESLRELGVRSVGRVLFTHHHRDQASGARLLGDGVELWAPAAELPLFANVAAFWNDPANRWGNFPLHTRMVLAEPLKVHDTLKDGDTVTWGPAKITAVATPGHTDGSLSYLVEVGGRRVVFCGDTLYDGGQVLDLFSLQKGTQTTDYHGYMGAWPELAESLRRLKALGPEVLVPSHGKLVGKPAEGIDLLLERLERCYDRYVAISALRHYFPKMFAAYSGREGHMAIRPGKPVPDCLLHFGTTWVVVSKDRAAFVMDCGGPAVLKQLKKLLAEGTIRSVEGLWITHYHNDHVDAVPEFLETFRCPCIADRRVAEVITRPLAWRLPCMPRKPVKVDRVTKEGESWGWREFKMTAYHLPGQTLYHGGLLVERGGLRMFFIGDSFTMAGIDDYCMFNRNWLGRDVGFDHCLALLARLRPTHLFNCHVDEAFDFTDDELAFMRRNLAERRELFAQVMPWEDPNFGLDEPWVRCFPYEQKARAGETVGLAVWVTNHADGPRRVRCRPNPPLAWQPPRDTGRPAWAEAVVPPKSEHPVPLRVEVPREARPGRHVVTVDVCFAQWVLPERAEAIIEVG